MTYPRSLEAGEPAGGLAARLRSAVTRTLRWMGRHGRRPGAQPGAQSVEQNVELSGEQNSEQLAAADDAQFSAHVEQALQIIREVPVPRVVTLPQDRSHVGTRR